jgi:hypothetical protein
MPLTVGSIRQSEWITPFDEEQPPAGHELVSPCVVASSITEPVPVNVSVRRVKAVAVPPPWRLYRVEPVYWMEVAPSVDHAKISPPVGCELAVFIVSPIGVAALLFLMPMYRLENAPAVPVQV